MRGLIVNRLNGEGTPYAKLIVTDTKTWEIRKSSTNVRGSIGIIYHDEFLGTANLVGVDGPYTPLELAEYYGNHLVILSDLKSYSQGKKLYAWVLKDAKKFEKPKKIKRIKGQVIWVNIN